jgi:serine/threonine-protein kinase HipA
VKIRSGVVLFDDKPCGLIEESEQGSRFTYSPDWIARDGKPISLTMPVREEPYVSKGLLPFFENLLPEGWLLDLTTAKLKIAKDDAFGLLIATCADCPGAISVEPLAEGPR